MDGNVSHGIIQRQVIVDGNQVAFKAGEQVTIESVQPNPQNPAFKYVVFSNRLQKRFQLSDEDVQIRQVQQPQQSFQPEFTRSPQTPSRIAGSIQTGSTVIMKGDVRTRDGRVAFSMGEKAVVKGVSPNPDPTRPEYKYVVVSTKLRKNIRLQDKDIQLGGVSSKPIKTQNTQAQPKTAKAKKEKTKWSELSRQQRKVRIWAVVIVIIVIIVTVSFVFFPNKNSSANLESTGTATQEASVGDDVTWTATVTNKGTKDVADLEVNTDFGGLQFVSIDPKPADQPIQDVQHFGPLRSGQSLTITYHLLAVKVGVANGMISFSEKGEALVTANGLSPQTIVR